MLFLLVFLFFIFFVFFSSLLFCPLPFSSLLISSYLFSPLPFFFSFFYFFFFFYFPFSVFIRRLSLLPAKLRLHQIHSFCSTSFMLFAFTNSIVRFLFSPLHFSALLCCLQPFFPFFHFASRKHCIYQE